MAYMAQCIIEIEHRAELGSSGTSFQAAMLDDAVPFSKPDRPSFATYSTVQRRDAGHARTSQ